MSEVPSRALFDDFSPMWISFSWVGGRSLVLELPFAMAYLASFFRSIFADITTRKTKIFRQEKEETRQREKAIPSDLSSRGSRESNQISKLELELL